MPDSWYGRASASQIPARGEIWEVSRNGSGLFLQNFHRGITLFEFVQMSAGELFFRFQETPPFYWVVLDEDRKTASLPDVVFIPDGVNQGHVFSSLSAQTQVAA